MVSARRPVTFGDSRPWPSWRRRGAWGNRAAMAEKEALTAARRIIRRGSQEAMMRGRYLYIVASRNGANLGAPVITRALKAEISRRAGSARILHVSAAISRCTLALDARGSAKCGERRSRIGSVKPSLKTACVENARRCGMREIEEMKAKPSGAWPEMGAPHHRRGGPGTLSA